MPPDLRSCITALHIPQAKSPLTQKSHAAILTSKKQIPSAHEALHAYEELKKEDDHIRVIDLYCIKPLDQTTLQEAATATKAIITVKDHFAEGGIGEAVRSAVTAPSVPVYSLAVRKMPKSGTPEGLLNYEEISGDAIIRKAQTILRSLCIQ